MYQELYQQGMAKAAAGEWSAAIDLLSQVLQLQPDFGEAYYQRGRLYFKLSQFSAAIDDYSRALMENASDANLYYARSLAYLSAGSLESAIADAKDAIRLRSNWAAAYHLLGTVRQRQNITDKAIASYKKAAELYLDQQDVANCRRCLEQIRQLQPAQTSPLQTNQSNLPAPISAEEFLQQAVGKATFRSYSSAIEDLDWAIQIDPQDAQAYVCRAQVRAKFDDRWGAIADYRQAAKLYLDRADKAMAQQMLDKIEQLKASQVRTLQSSQRSQGSQRQTSSRSFRQRPTTGRVSPAIQRKMLRLVGDDRKIAAGLVDRLRERHPGMPEDWYWEKAIYDLERDRH